MTIVVDAPYRNTGIGTKLLDTFYGYLKQKGSPALFLCVDKRNPAVNLFLRTGIKIIRSNENDYFMLKELSWQ